MRELNKKIARGIAWMGALKVFMRAISVVSTVILARLLTPTDFGLIAMAMSIIALLELTTAFSFDVPLIQKQQAERGHFDTAWTLNLLFHLLLALLLVALARPAAGFYGEERLTHVIYALAVGFIARGFTNIGIVHFRRNLDFGKRFSGDAHEKIVRFRRVHSSRPDIQKLLGSRRWNGGR